MPPVKIILMLTSIYVVTLIRAEIVKNRLQKRSLLLTITTKKQRVSIDTGAFRRSYYDQLFINTTEQEQRVINVLYL